MLRDFGPGLTADELIGLNAWMICQSKLPPGEIFNNALTAARIMAEGGMEAYLLLELWEDGHSVWGKPGSDKPVLVTPTGQFIRSKP